MEWPGWVSWAGDFAALAREAVAASHGALPLADLDRATAAVRPPPGPFARSLRECVERRLKEA